MFKEKWDEITFGEHTFKYIDGFNTSVMLADNYYAVMFIPSTCILYTLWLDKATSEDEAISIYNSFYRYTMAALDHLHDYTNYHSVIHVAEVKNGKVCNNSISGKPLSELLKIVREFHGSFEIIERISNSSYEMSFNGKRYMVIHNPAIDKLELGYWIICAIGDAVVAISPLGNQDDDSIKPYIDNLIPYIKVILGPNTRITFMKSVNSNNSTSIYKH